MEFHVRSFRLTDLEACVRIMSHDVVEPEAEKRAADFLPNLLYVPAATVIVAEAGRRVVGIGVLSIRPSVRSGPFIGAIDELGVTRGDMDDADRRTIGSSLVEHLVGSARNKGCTRVEVSESLASAEPTLWEASGFASHGRLLSRSIG